MTASEQAIIEGTDTASRHRQFIELLRQCAALKDRERGHILADYLLQRKIGDPEIRHIYEAAEFWYA